MRYESWYWVFVFTIIMPISGVIIERGDWIGYVLIASQIPEFLNFIQSRDK